MQIIFKKLLNNKMTLFMSEEAIRFSLLAHCESALVTSQHKRFGHGNVWRWLVWSFSNRLLLRVVKESNNINTEGFPYSAAPRCGDDCISNDG